MYHLRRASGSIRTRIALTIFAVATAALVVMALAVFLSFRAVLADSLDDSVRARAVANLELVERTGGALRLPLGSLSGSPTDDEGAVVQLYGADGALLNGRGAAPLAGAKGRALLEQALRGREVSATLRLGGQSFRVLALPLGDGSTVVGVLVTGLPWEQVNEPLELLRAILLLAVPLISAVLAVGAFIIARRALRPIQTMTTTARTIAGGDLRRRITGVSSRDELGELAATFNTMIGRLAETIERERRFTGDASHELRTPLTAMETALDVTLSHPRTPEEYRQALQTVRTQTARMTRMTRQLLLLSRLDADAVPRDRTPVLCAELLEAVLDDFRPRHPHVTVLCEPSSGDATVLADPEMLARAFTNVIENAATHAGPSTTIRVTTRRVPGAITVTFSDVGPGFPVALLGSAFQRFRRGDGSAGRDGTGLGLAIVASIARLHGGSVRIANAAAGALVEFTLPTADERAL